MEIYFMRDNNISIFFHCARACIRLSTREINPGQVSRESFRSAPLYRGCVTVLGSSR